MGSGASLTLAKELEKPLDASDVNTPRGLSSVEEVRRLRTMLLMQEAEHMRAGEQLDKDIVDEEKHEEAVNYEKALVELFEAADEDMDGELSLQEFRSVMQRSDLGLSDKDIFALAHSVDDDHNNMVVWREFLPVALQLVDGMEAQGSAQVSHMEVQSWADHEATEMEALYANSFEESIEHAIKNLTESDGNGSASPGGGGAFLLPKELVVSALKALPAPLPLEFTLANDAAFADVRRVGNGTGVGSRAGTGSGGAGADGGSGGGGNGNNTDNEARGDNNGPSPNDEDDDDDDDDGSVGMLGAEDHAALAAAAAAANQSGFNTRGKLSKQESAAFEDDELELEGGEPGPAVRLLTVTEVEQVAFACQTPNQNQEPASPSAASNSKTTSVAFSSSSSRGSRKEQPLLCDCTRVREACLDVRFSKLKEELVGMTYSAMHSYLLGKARILSATCEANGAGCGLEGALMLTKPQLQRLFALDPALPLAPLQIMGLLKLAKPIPLTQMQEELRAKGGGGGSSNGGQNRKKGAPPINDTAKFVNCKTYIPIAATVIENMFDLKFLVRRSQLLKRGALRPVELLHGADRDALEKKLANLFQEADKDMDGGLSKGEFMKCIKALDLGLEMRDIEALRIFADTDGDGMVNPSEFMRFAFTSLLHLLREQALQLASDMTGGSDEHADGEAVEETDLAGNPAALVLQARTKIVIARKLVADIKTQHQFRSAQEVLAECFRRKASEATADGVAKVSSAVDVFTERAKRFNEAKKRQLAHHLKPDMPFAETLFPGIGIAGGEV